jgi:hypothetical protein
VIMGRLRRPAPSSRTFPEPVYTSPLSGRRSSGSRSTGRAPTSRSTRVGRAGCLDTYKIPFTTITEKDLAPRRSMTASTPSFSPRGHLAAAGGRRCGAGSGGGPGGGGGADASSDRNVRSQRRTVLALQRRLIGAD